ncbi:MAG: 4Fe-4S binding protein [Clostridia bacterium]|nr:4Fe-4S binding protein [Clostridia bacterium]
MVLRKIVHINEEKCNGCGLCIPSCHEGAIQIINGKAKLIADNLCDGLGNCLGECPQGAIEIIEREAEEFDEMAVQQRIKQLKKENSMGSGCPGSRPQFFGCPGSRPQTLETDANTSEKVNINSELRQWPVQLHLVPINAPYFQNADLLLCADCVPVAYPNFQQELLKDKAVAIACPKLDNTAPYAEKLAQIIKYNNIQSITIARMEVPCCGGLKMIVKQALEKAKVDIPVIEKIIGIRGNILR